jgi:cytochrome oxidase Cu insertion factor (SCO1/SenC/PrrC family)
MAHAPEPRPDAVRRARSGRARRTAHLTGGQRRALTGSATQGRPQTRTRLGPIRAADAAAPAFGTEIEFELTDASGKRVRAVDLRGRWLLIFFGYTYCPDLCPTALNEIAGALAQLGPLAAQVQPVFVSIDPQRDTPQALREYVQSFDARILPLSGNAEQLARAAGSLGVVFYKVPGPTPDEYTFAHNAIVTLVGPEGGIVTRFSSDAVVDDLARTLRRLIDPASS